jgi:anti-sigma B factor antagonist
VSSIKAHRLRHGVLRLALAGQFDLATAPALASAVRHALGTRRLREIRIDLDRVDLLDTATINILLDGWDRATLSGIRYRIVNAHGVPLRALLMTGVAITLTGPADKVRRRRPRRILHSRPPTSRHRAVAVAAGVLAFGTLAWLATGSVRGGPLPSQAAGGRTPPASSSVRPSCVDACRALTGTGDGLTATLTVTDLDSPARLRLVATALHRGPAGRPHRDVRTRNPGADHATRPVPSLRRNDHAAARAA